ncbi:MAG: TIGR04222 domain-containing membrane protein [Pseudonocardiaceae bacterium]
MTPTEEVAMGTPVSSNVTWGITGPAFLAGYGLLILAALFGIMVVRWRLATGPRDAGRTELGRQPHDIAYLNGGPELAVLSALSSMRVAGTIVAQGRGLVHAAQTIGSAGSELERAIHLAAIVPIAQRELVTHRIVRTALDAARQRLDDAGLLLSDERRRRIKRAGLWMVPVSGLGLVRLLAGEANAAPVGYLILELIAVGILAAVLLSWAPARSRCGTAELTRLRGVHNELDPRMRPDWTAYGPAVAGLGVGIFGASALWASDPAFAANLEAQRVTAGMGGSGYYGGGDGPGYYGGGGCGSAGHSGGGCGGGGGGCGGGCGGGG